MRRVVSVFPFHLAAILSNFPMLSKCLDSQVPASPEAWWELGVERNDTKAEGFEQHPPSQPGSQPLSSQQVFKMRSYLKGLF